jgi:hypothetical protein
MPQNLDGLKTEIEQHLEQAGLAVFYSHARALDNTPTVFWDCQQHPDYREFVQAAKAADVKLIVFHQREFAVEQIDDAMEQLAGCDLPREHYRDFERSLTQARAYDGFVCEIELSFIHHGSIFVFDLRTDWYRELSEVLGEIEVLTGIEGDDEDSSIGGYFSKN